MVNWEAIVIHHSLTPDQGKLDWQAIRRYHMDTLGWSDVGYQFCVEKVGSHWEALIGRGLDKAGAHTKQQGMNRKSIGVCLVGDFDVQQPEEGMLLFAVKKVIVPMMKVFRIPLNAVYPHRKFATYKSCPGKAFPWVTFIQMVHEAGGSASGNNTTTGQDVSRNT